MSNKRLDKKKVLITGAGSGIGRAAAVAMAEEGAVVCVSDISMESAKTTAQIIKDNRGSASALSMDVTSASDWEKAVDQIIAEHQGIDVLVNNAGIAPPTPILELSLEEFRGVNNVNVHGTFLGCKTVIAAMRATAIENEPAKGSIINIASAAANLAMENFSAYCTSKAAIANMCNVLGVEMGEAGDYIRVNSVNPGPVKTEMTLSMFGEEYYNNPDNFSFMPAKTYSEVEDVAHAIIYLASDESRLVTGSHLNVDSGLTAGLLVKF